MPKCVLLLAPLALAGCKTRSQGPTTEPPATVAADASKVDQAKKLALSSSNGTGGVDVLISQLQTLVTRTPQKGDLWILLGRAWVRKARETQDPGFYLNANAAAEVALDIDPEDKLATDLLALVLYNQHAFEAARALEATVAREHPDDPQAYATLCDALLELGRFEEAEKAAQTMMDLKPNLPSYVRASYIQWTRGDFAGALASARSAIDAGGDPRDPEPRAWAITQSAYLFWNGDPAALTGKAKGADFDGADAGFDRALDALSEYPPALVGKGRVALARGNFARAVDVLGRAYGQSPLVETAWLLGDAKELAGDRKGADEMFALVEKDGQRSDQRTLSLFWSTKNKRAADALRLAEEERKTRGDVFMDDAYAWALYRNGKLAEARAASDHALRLGTKEPRLMFHAGAIRIAMGDRAGGAKLIKDAMTLNPKFDVTASAEAERLLVEPGAPPK